MGLGESLVSQVRGSSREQFVDPYARKPAGQWLVDDKETIVRKPAGQGLVDDKETIVQRPRRQRPKKQSKIADIAAGLWAKLITGNAAAGEGVIPYARVPRAIRDQIPLDAPPVGWDETKLTPQERALLQRMGAMEGPAFTNG